MCELSVDDRELQSEQKDGDRDLCDDKIEFGVQNEMMNGHKIEILVQNEVMNGHKKVGTREFGTEI